MNDVPNLHVGSGMFPNQSLSGPPSVGNDSNGLVRMALCMADDVT